MISRNLPPTEYKVGDEVLRRLRSMKGRIAPKRRHILKGKVIAICECVFNAKHTLHVTIVYILASRSTDSLSDNLPWWRPRHFGRCLFAI